MKANYKNAAVVIPVYNAANYMEILIEEIRNFFPVENIIAVNDGSIDDSSEICRSLIKNVIDLPKNKGKGAALIAGFERANSLGFSFAFSIDSDLQHKPEDLPRFLEKQNRHQANLVIGRRSFSYKKMPFHRIMSNVITSGIVSSITQRTIFDSQSGYRLYDLNMIKNLKFRSQRYQFETEVILRIAKLNGIIDFIWIDTLYSGEKSHISHFRDIWNFIKVILYFTVSGF
ncbi:MAG: glycosyltransferase family 2 protein [Candidatus Cloacimonetes bacterium]|nr:glycosyltransferase family 2 protein [Candidatus Cloacimonadota bacterium]